jgi:hypothetical protein
MVLFCSVEAAGIEPSADFVASESGICNCENCQQCRAANALHFECFKSHFQASLDADLQRVIDGWDRLDTMIRHIIAAHCSQSNLDFDSTK